MIGARILTPPSTSLSGNLISVRTQYFMSHKMDARFEQVKTLSFYLIALLEVLFKVRKDSSKRYSI